MGTTLRLFALLAVLLSGPRLSAFHILLHGEVTEYFTGDRLKGVQVRMVKDSIDRETIITPRDGRYEMYLERGYEYLIWFSKDGFVTKHVRIDTRDIPPVPDVPFYDMFLQMTMVIWVDGVDFGILERPIAEAHYRHSVRNLTWDTEYTESVRKRLVKVMDHYERTFNKDRGVKGTAAREEKEKGARTKRKRVDF